MMSLSRVGRFASTIARPSRRAISSSSHLLSTTHDNPVPVNDPSQKNPGGAPVASPTPTTNATPVASVASDAALVEDPAVAEEMRQMQAPNRAETWSKSQRPREQAMVGPRFEQAIMADQVCSLLAILRLYTDIFAKATTNGSHRPCPQATGPVDEKQTGLL